MTCIGSSHGNIILGLTVFSRGILAWRELSDSSMRARSIILIRYGVTSAMVRGDWGKAIFIAKDFLRIAEVGSCRALEENL